MDTRMGNLPGLRRVGVGDEYRAAAAALLRPWRLAAGTLPTPRRICRVADSGSPLGARGSPATASVHWPVRLRPGGQPPSQARPAPPTAEQSHGRTLAAGARVAGRRLLLPAGLRRRRPAGRAGEEQAAKRGLPLTVVELGSAEGDGSLGRLTV